MGEKERERGGGVLAWSVSASGGLMLGCSSAHRSSRRFNQFFAISFFLCDPDSSFEGAIPRTLCPHLEVTRARGSRRRTTRRRMSKHKNDVCAGRATYSFRSQRASC